MHIPDNYLSPATCGTLVTAMVPVWTVAVLKVKVQLKTHRETLPMLGIAASLAFLIMMFNLPIPGGRRSFSADSARCADSARF